MRPQLSLSMLIQDWSMLMQLNLLLAKTRRSVQAVRVAASLSAPCRQ